MTECVKAPKHCPFCASESIKSAHDETPQERQDKYGKIARKASDELHGRTASITQGTSKGK